MKTKFCSVLAAATTLAGIIATTGSAKAASLSYNSPPPVLEATNFNQNLSIQKFDSALGTLNSVEIDFTGNLAGNAKFESLDAGTSTVKADLSANMTLQLSNQPLFLITLKPDSNTNYSLTAYDGTLDFGGTSGKTVNGLTATDSKTQTITDSSLLNSFTSTSIGTSPDLLHFLVAAQGASSFSGAGNLLAQSNISASTDLKVTYNYEETPPVKAPEPSALIGVGLVAGFGLLSQRKRTFSKA